MKIEKVNFSYNTNAVSKKQYEEHLKLYTGYVNKVNEINDELVKDPKRKESNAAYSKYRGLKKGETFCLDGVILHEEYFKNMTTKTETPGKNAMLLINRFFGSYDAWLEDFKACATSARGWCITSFDQRQKSVKNFLLDAHDDGVVCMAFPIIVLDMYEHAYFLDYGTNKAEYISKFVESINWKIVEARAARVTAEMN